MFMRSLMTGLALAICIGQLSNRSLGQVAKPNPKVLGVDYIKTTKHLFFGFVLNRQADGSIECAVEREWLKANLKDAAEELSARELKGREEIKQLTITRIKAWIDECTTEDRVRLKFFLENELSHAEAVQPEASDSIFVVLTIPPTEIVKVVPAKPEFRHIAGVAYQHGLREIPVTSATALARQLKEQGIDPGQESFDLSSKLPTLVRESDRQWSARQALVEHDVVEAFEVQGGAGNQLMGANDAIDINVIFQEFASAQSELMKELAKDLKLDLPGQTEKSEKEAWKRSASDKAERKKLRGVLVFRSKQNLNSDTAQVESSFLAKDVTGTWFELYHATHENDGAKASKEELDRMKQDPNVKPLLAMVEAIGGGAQVERALRQGAAVSLALGEARRAFSDFKRPHTRDLLSPPIPIREEK